MSAALMRKLFGVEAAAATTVTPEESHRDEIAPKPPANPFVRAAPETVRQFARLLTREGFSDDVSIGGMTMKASITMAANSIKAGKMVCRQEMMLKIDHEALNSDALKPGESPSPQTWWNQINTGQCTLPYSLAVMMVGYDMTDMPLDVQISLKGFAVGHERRFGERSNGDAVLRDQVLLRNKVEIVGQMEPRALLTRPLVCTEPLTGTQFGSIEAIGFKSKDFWAGPLKAPLRVTDDAAPAMARLFTTNATPLSARDPATRRDSDGSSSSFYYLPLSYRYTSLIVRVHRYLAVQRIRREAIYELDKSAIDPSLYEVPRSSDFYIFEAAALQDAVRFIDERLVDVHPILHPDQLRVDIEPCITHNSWLDAWQARKNTDRSIYAGSDMRMVGVAERSSKDFHCTVTFIVFYAVYRPDRSLWQPGVHTIRSGLVIPTVDEEEETEEDVHAYDTHYSSDASVHFETKKRGGGGKNHQLGTLDVLEGSEESVVIATIEHNASPPSWNTLVRRHTPGPEAMASASTIRGGVKVPILNSQTFSVTTDSCDEEDDLPKTPVVSTKRKSSSPITIPSAATTVVVIAANDSAEATIVDPMRPSRAPPTPPPLKRTPPLVPAAPKITRTPPPKPPSPPIFAMQWGGNTMGSEDMQMTGEIRAQET